MKILFIEDNVKLSKYLAKALERESYIVDAVFDGIEGEYRALDGTYDLIILDIMLPGKNGVDVCRSIREHKIATPIIMMTAKGELHDRITGLDIGADDYLVKPVAIEELTARVRALLRRPPLAHTNILSVGDVILDSAKHQVHARGEEVALTTKEFSILDLLMRNMGLAISREQILEKCWDFAYTGTSNIVDVNIKSLRKKLGGENEKYIETVRGIGYKFKQS